MKPVAGKIIFLDFDGPLSNTRVTLAYGDDDHMDPVACRALNSICEASGAKIVCVSTRALDGNSANRQENFWRLEQAGLDLRNVHPDWTCRNNRGSREEAISDWLSRHQEASHYVIIDDESVDLPNLVKVDMMSGIATDHFRQIAGIMGVELVEAINEARRKILDLNQTVIPFNRRDEDFNARIILASVDHPDTEAGAWKKFPRYIEHRNYQDGRMTVEFMNNATGDKGCLSAAIDDIRKGPDHSLYFKAGARVVLKPVKR